MIGVRPIDRDYYNGFIMQGHANYAPHGQDIVCAGVTSALYTTYYALCNMKGDDYIELVAENGYASLKINTPDLATDAVIDGFLETLGATQETYPGTITIEGDCNHEQRI